MPWRISENDRPEILQEMTCVILEGTRMLETLYGFRRRLNVNKFI